MLRYLKEVLGIHEIILPEQQGVEVLFLTSPQLHQSESELLQKIIQAMKLKKNSFAINQIKELSSCKWIVSFGQNVSTDNPHISQLPDLKDILQNPQIKKEVWSELQKAMSHLQAGPMS